MKVIIDNKILNSIKVSQDLHFKPESNGISFQTVLENLNQENKMIQNHEKINLKEPINNPTEETFQNRTENHAFKFEEETPNSNPQRIDPDSKEKKEETNPKESKHDEEELKEDLKVQENNEIRQDNDKKRDNTEGINEKRENLKEHQKNHRVDEFNKNQNNSLHVEKIENTDIKKRNISNPLRFQEIQMNLANESLNKEINLNNKKNHDTQKSVTKITAHQLLNYNELKENHQTLVLKLKQQIHEHNRPVENPYKNFQISANLIKRSEDLVKEVLQKEVQKSQPKQHQQNQIVEILTENSINFTKQKELIEKEAFKFPQNPKIEIYHKIETKQQERSAFEQKDFQNQNFMNFSLNLQKSHKLNLQSISQDPIQKTIKEAFDEIISKARIQVGNQQFSAQIRLNPSIFGYMSINMNYENGSLVLKILVDNHDVYKRLQESIDSIKYEFSKNGIQLETVQVRFKETSHNQNDPQFSMMFDSNSNDTNGKSSNLEYQQNESIYIEENENLSNQKQKLDDNEFIDRFESVIMENEKSYGFKRIKNHIYWG